MAYRIPLSSSKQTSAVILNLKESQFLDKTIQTLNQEKSYSSKLKELDIKFVNFYYNRLKNTVRKIHSHLGPEDISVLQKLEDEGRMFKTPKYVLASNSYLKIEAARRRLGLSKNRRRVISAMPRIQLPDSFDQSKDKIKLPNCPQACKRRVNSAGVSVERTLDEEELTDGSGSSEGDGRSSTYSTNFKRRQSLAPKSVYSCHDPKPLDANGEAVNILENFGLNPYEVRRQKLLVAESQFFNQLLERKEDFVDEVETFVIENPSITEYHPGGAQGSLINVLSSMFATKRKTRSLESQMDEMRKSRYLRIDDQLIDNSEHVTNAKQMVDQTKAWRNFTKTKGKSVRASVTL